MTVPFTTPAAPAPAPAPAPSSAIDPAYLQQLQCSRQWRGFLAALGAEFASALPQQDLFMLMARVGMRFASAHPLAPSQTVEGLQAAMNQIWTAFDWGVVGLRQTQAGMEIWHRFSPLTAAFGEERGLWATGFLQGAYQQWLEAAGGTGLRVDVMAPADLLGSVHLRLVVA